MGLKKIINQKKEEMEKAIKTGEFTMGSKKPVKEIDLNPKQTLAVFLGFVLISAFIIMAAMNFLDNSGIAEKELKFECSDGTVEIIETGKEYYCEQHYTELKNFISLKSYKKIEGRILGE